MRVAHIFASRLSAVVGDARVALLAALLLAPTAATAQSLAQRIDAAGADAAVFFRFESHPDVCGVGEDIVMHHDSSREGISFIQQSRDGSYRASRDRIRSECRRGPVLVELTRADRRITHVRLTVASNESPAGLDLGTVTPADAVTYLLDHAVPRADSRPADKLVLAAVLANAESWPALLRVARDRDLPQSPRNTAIFWLAQQAGDKATAGLTSLVGDNSDELEVRKTAVFALSQIKSEETITQLMRIARTNPEPEIRKNAMFWLGQSRDPRVIAFFEEILKGG